VDWGDGTGELVAPWTIGRLMSRSCGHVYSEAFRPGGDQLAKGLLCGLAAGVRCWLPACRRPVGVRDDGPNRWPGQEGGAGLLWPVEALVPVMASMASRQRLAPRSSGAAPLTPDGGLLCLPSPVDGKEPALGGDVRQRRAQPVAVEWVLPVTGTGLMAWMDVTSPHRRRVNFFWTG